MEDLLVQDEIDWKCSYIASMQAYAQGMQYGPHAQETDEEPPGLGAAATPVGLRPEEAAYTSCSVAQEHMRNFLQGVCMRNLQKRR